MLESLFNKAASFQTSNFIKKRLQHRCFTLNIAKFLRAAILKNIYKRLFLNEEVNLRHRHKPLMALSQKCLTAFSR